MTAKRWCISFVACVAVIAALLMSFNLVTDPVGVFGDRFLNWYSYDMTKNPRAAKITYLDEHHDEYDAYVLGASASSSLLTQTLNRYTGASFYNMIMYGSDMLDVEQTAQYLIENYRVKHLVVTVSLTNGLNYAVEQSPILYNMHYKTNGTSPLSFFSRYLFLDPRYGFEKLAALGEDTLLAQPFDVFDVQTGSYDKRSRDAEAIGDLSAYLAAYPEFSAVHPQTPAMGHIAATAESLARIRDKCAANGITLTVLIPPSHAPHLQLYNRQDVTDFYTAIAEVSDFWDFSYSSVSFDPRYFYDYSHFRNSVGDMVLARIYGDTSAYFPPDFGAIVTHETVSAHMETYWDVQPAAPQTTTADLPILCYHNLTESPAEVGQYTMLATDFRAQMQQLAAGGYHPVSLTQIEDFVLRGIPLPANPVAITFDDGYESNYTLAYPILKEFQFPATIFAVGATVGNQTNYKDTSFPITPHFTNEEAAEMTRSGLISVQSHTYDMHQWEPYEPQGAVVRTDILPLAEETEADYVAYLTADFEKSRAALETATGQPVTALAFPKGKYTRLTQAALTSAGVTTTFSTTQGRNTLLMGLPQSLLCLHRFSVLGATTPAELAEYLAYASSPK